MRRGLRLAGTDQLRVLVIGAGLVGIAYLVNRFITASAAGEKICWRVLLPGAGEIPADLLLLSILSLFAACVLNLLLKRRRMVDALVKYQAGMDASIDGIAILNRNHRCVYVNDSYAALYGFASHAEASGRPWRMFYDERENDRFLTEIFPVLHRSGKWHGEVVGLRKDGSSFPQEISLTRIDAENYVCIVRDITPRKDFEARLQRKAWELAAANEELEAFSYSLTHDVRNHIARILSAAQLLEDGFGEIPHLTEIIGGTCREMEALVNDMLVLSYIIQREICRESVDLGEIARVVTAELMLAEPARSVEVSIAPGMLAECDRHLLKIALRNLLGNAWKYTGRVPLAKIEFGVHEQDGERVFFVRDNGLGFDMGDAGRLFRPFERLANAGDFPGTGIGLATVQRVIQRHGGTIRGEGEPGLGATFYFTLPRLQGLG